jgi:oligogalacturonide lyase
MKNYSPVSLIFCTLIIFSSVVSGQIGTRFPSEKKTVTDPVTGTQLTFLTSKPAGDSKIYQTHPQWTSDGNWIIFRSNRVRGEAMAVNEKSGIIIQVTEGGYTGMLCVARKSMKLYVMRYAGTETGRQRGGPMQVVEVDLASLFADSETGKLKTASGYQKVCGTIPAEMPEEIWHWMQMKNMFIIVSGVLKLQNIFRKIQRSNRISDQEIWELARPG